MAKMEVHPDGCWRWKSSLNSGGYGRFGTNGVRQRAHRVSYEHFIGPIPEGREVDHLCHTADLSCSGGASCPHRACVNPQHLEVVSHRENCIRGRSRAAENAAKSVCQYGHPLDGGNTYFTKTGGRHCRTCDRRRARESRARNNPPKGTHSRDKTHCPAGHPYKGDNLRIAPDGSRVCRACKRAKYHENKAKNPPAPKVRERPTHCIHGHEFSPENTRVRANGAWACKECGRRVVRERRARMKQEQQAS